MQVDRSLLGLFRLSPPDVQTRVWGFANFSLFQMLKYRRISKGFKKLFEDKIQEVWLRRCVEATFNEWKIVTGMVFTDKNVPALLAGQATQPLALLIHHASYVLWKPVPEDAKPLHLLRELGAFIKAHNEFREQVGNYLLSYQGDPKVVEVATARLNQILRVKAEKWSERMGFASHNWARMNVIDLGVILHGKTMKQEKMAYLWRGIDYIYGITVPAPMVEAGLARLEDAANLNCEEACEVLGTLLCTGADGVAKNEEKGRPFLNKAKKERNISKREIYLNV